jgi:hypothetical protein
MHICLCVISIRSCVVQEAFARTCVSAPLGTLPAAGTYVSPQSSASQATDKLIK